MSFYIAARIDTKAILETGSNSIDMSISYDRSQYMSALSANYDTPTSNIFLYHEETPLSDEANLVMEGATWSATWTGDTITAIDLSEEYAKKWVSVSVDKDIILADGVEEVILKVELLLADKSGVDTTFEGNIDILIGKSKSRFNFYKGLASRSFKTTESGYITFPSIKNRFGNYRVNNQVTFETIN